MRARGRPWRGRLVRDGVLGVGCESFLYRGVSCELQAAKCTLELGSMSRETTKSTRGTMVRGLQTRSLRWPSRRGSFAKVVSRQERLGRTDVYYKLSRRSEREGMRGRAERVNAIYAYSTIDYEYSSSGPLVLAERPTPTGAGYDDVLIPARARLLTTADLYWYLIAPYSGSRDASSHKSNTPTI